MSAPTAKPSTAPAEPSKPQAQRYVPGADGLASKRPKKKKANANGHTAPTSTMTGNTPVALLSKAPSASELPAELLAEKGEIERELKEDAAAAAASGGHEKGPIGEAVSRRMKVLTKKIQRFRAYTEKPEASLNPDQKAAIATLPALEGGLRELEDIAKSVETIEHEHRNSSRQELENAKLEAVEVYKSETLPLLATIISVHSSLHPASVSTSTSFIPVDLPPHLQEISSQDVSAIDDMYERLRNGGKEGVEVVLTLVKGLEGTHLHSLLSGAQTSGSTGPSVEQQEDSTPVFSPAAQDEALPETSEINPPASLSFLQQTNDVDETAHAARTATAMGAFEQGPNVADSAPKEVTPAHAEGMSFMQTSELPVQHTHQQSPFQSDHFQVQQGAYEGGPGMGMENAFKAGENVESAPAPSVAQLEGQALSAQQPSSFNWADAEDSHHVPETFSVSGGSEAPLASAPAPAAVTERVSVDASGIAPPLALEATGGVHPAQQTQGQRGRGGRGGRGGFRGGPRGGFRRNGPANPNSDNKNNNNNTGDNKAGPSTGADADGFQVAGRRRPPPAPGAPGGNQGGSFRGRGRGFPGGPGANTEGGRGRGRGRGGAANGPRPPNAGAQKSAPAAAVAATPTA